MIGARKEKQIALPAHCGDVRRWPIRLAGYRISHRPENLARGWVERTERVGEPDYKLAPATGFIDHGRTVTDLFRGQGSPYFFARVLFKGDDGASLAANLAIEEIAIQEGMGSPAPHGRVVELVVLHEVLSPVAASRGGIQAAQI